MFLLLFFCLLLTGCDSSNTNGYVNNIVNNQTNDNEEIDIGGKYESFEWKCSVILDDIINFSGFDNKFITKDGELYNYSFDQLFTNNDYCKKIDTTYKFKRFINGSIVTTDNKSLAYVDGKLIENYGWTGGFDYELLKLHNDLFELHRNNGILDLAGISYYGYNDGNKVILYNYNVNKIEEKYELSDGEEFVEGYYHIFKTNKKYYYNSIINKEECNKYADVECKYGITPIDDINKVYDKIYYFNGKILIYNHDKNHVYMYRYNFN